MTRSSLRYSVLHLIVVDFVSTSKVQKFESKNYGRVTSIFTALTSKLSQHRVNAMLFSMVVMTWGSLKYIQSYAESKSPDGCSKNHKRKLSMKKLRAGSIDQLILVYG